MMVILYTNPACESGSMAEVCTGGGGARLRTPPEEDDVDPPLMIGCLGIKLFVTGGFLNVIGVLSTMG